MSHQYLAGPMSRWLLSPVLILVHDLHFRYRVALQTPFVLICAAIP